MVYLNNDNDLISIPIGGGVTATLAADVSSDFFIPADSTQVIYRNGGGLNSVPIIGGMAVLLSDDTITYLVITHESSAITGPGRHQTRLGPAQHN